MNSLKISVLLAVIAFIATFCNATNVSKCQNSAAPQLDSNDVTISNCNKNKCILKRKADTTIEIKLRPQKEIKKLVQNVNGIILDVPLPFPGVDGTSACPYIFEADGVTKAGCPMKAGESYVYRNTFPILEFYPTIDVIVHWALNDGKDDLVCFRVPARIK